MPTRQMPQPDCETPVLTMVSERRKIIAEIDGIIFLLPFAHAMKF
jgi:hypothetical protein